MTTPTDSGDDVKREKQKRDAWVDSLHPDDVRVLLKNMYDQNLQTDPHSCQVELERVRGALEALVIVASDKIDFDQENQVPVCHCCGVELDKDGKGHRIECLADMVIEASKLLRRDTLLATVKGGTE